MLKTMKQMVVMCEGGRMLQLSENWLWSIQEWRMDTRALKLQRASFTCFNFNFITSAAKRADQEQTPQIISRAYLGVITASLRDFTER